MNMLALMNAAERTRSACVRAVEDLLLTETIDRSEIAAALSSADGIIRLLAHEVRAIAAVPEAPAPPPSDREKPRKPASSTPRARAPKGQGAHRHKFDGDKCACGATRQRAGRKPNAPADAGGVVSPPLPVVNSRPLLGDHVDDAYDGGTMGSSGTSDRR